MSLLRTGWVSLALIVALSCADSGPAVRVGPVGEWEMDRVGALAAWEIEWRAVDASSENDPMGTMGPKIERMVATTMGAFGPAPSAGERRRELYRRLLDVTGEYWRFEADGSLVVIRGSNDPEPHRGSWRLEAGGIVSIRRTGDEEWIAAFRYTDGKLDMPLRSGGSNSVPFVRRGSAPRGGPR